MRILARWMPPQNSRLLGSMACLLLFAVGCSSNSNLAPVSGIVTERGKPVAEARISFQPASEQVINTGPGSYARTDSSGRFQLKTVDKDRPGAIIGPHKVQIVMPGSPDIIRDDDLRAAKIKSFDFVVPPQGTSEAAFEVAP